MAARSNRKQKSATRLYATQALFQMEATGADMDKTMQEFETHRFGATLDEDRYEEGDIDLFRAIIRAAVSNQAAIDQRTDKALVKRWPIGRIDPTLRSIFRAAGAEISEGKTPVKVVIAEYVELARAFFPEGKESGLVNAVLDHIVKETYPERLQP